MEQAGSDRDIHRGEQIARRLWNTEVVEIALDGDDVLWHVALFDTPLERRYT